LSNQGAYDLGMKNEKLDYLKLSNSLPARVNSEEASWLLGFAPHDIPVLVKAGLIKPLGRPAQSAVKYFAAVELEELKVDRKWLSRATEVVYGHWREKIIPDRATRLRKSHQPDNRFCRPKRAALR
jgi:hypothetical protein